MQQDGPCHPRQGNPRYAVPDANDCTTSAWASKTGVRSHVRNTCVRPVHRCSASHSMPGRKRRRAAQSDSEWTPSKSASHTEGESPDAEQESAAGPDRAVDSTSSADDDSGGDAQHEQDPDSEPGWDSLSPSSSSPGGSGSDGVELEQAADSEPDWTGDSSSSSTGESDSFSQASSSSDEQVDDTDSQDEDEQEAVQTEAAGFGPEARCVMHSPEDGDVNEQLPAAAAAASSSAAQQDRLGPRQVAVLTKLAALADKASSNATEHEAGNARRALVKLCVKHNLDPQQVLSGAAEQLAAPQQLGVEQAAEVGCYRVALFARGTQQPYCQTPPYLWSISAAVALLNGAKAVRCRLPPTANSIIGQVSFQFVGGKHNARAAALQFELALNEAVALGDEQYQLGHFRSRESFLMGYGADLLKWVKRTNPGGLSAAAEDAVQRALRAFGFNLFSAQHGCTKTDPASYQQGVQASAGRRGQDRAVVPS